VRGVNDAQFALLHMANSWIDRSFDLLREEASMEPRS
jgi:hypothetical protein